MESYSSDPMRWTSFPNMASQSTSPEGYGLVVQEAFKAIFGGIEIGKPYDFDGLGDRNFKCPQGHWNYRREYNVPERVCQHDGCNEKVDCKDQVPLAASSMLKYTPAVNYIYETNERQSRTRGYT